MSEESTPYKDRKVGLIVFGVLQIIIGGFCALAVPMMILSAVMVSTSAPNTGVSATAMIPAILVYAVAAVAFVWLGIGSILARRWARALHLVFSSIMFVSGLLGSIMAIFFLRGMLGGMPHQEQLPPGFQAMMMGITVFVIGFIYIIIPGAHILFYRSPNVKATCEDRDPRERWTDRCPLTVIALCVLVIMWGCGQLSMVGYNCAVPFFGIILTGLPGAGWMLLCAGVGILLAIRLYKLRPAAWWATLAALLVFVISYSLTFARIDMMDYYAIMGLPAEQLELMRNMPMTQGNVMWPMMVIYAIPFLAFAISIRKHFFDKS